ncbi:MAG TPA: transcription termination/antitermination protein NusG [Candidatus Borkfalkia faecipullorum]|uniref:Transcription termination/antitermination protein NusG n=1 Tax=Candidatus Borkfalkia faecipullorum TaxID=2838510 RepID=A0A9D1V7Z2_9FIRM|nr:transcription termination/antitermination protein NusG [Candidatus Borkfalkia faecipullorum]
MENSRESQAKWYVLHTYSGYEMMVKSSLEQLIENNNLQDSIFDLRIPMEQTIEEKGGKKKVVERKLLPCYVFIKMIYSNQVWYLVTNTRGVTGFVGPQGRPLPLKDEEVRKMQLEKVVDKVDFVVGDTVSIDAGPLAGFVGQIKELNDSTQKAKVNVLMFGRNTDVEVDYVQIRKIDVADASAADKSQEQG